jgi:hypothetical protein
MGGEGERPLFQGHEGRIWGETQMRGSIFTPTIGLVDGQIEKE